MSHRLTLRAAVLTASVAGALLIPSAAAFADGTPTPAPKDAASVQPKDGNPRPVPAEDGTPRPVPAEDDREAKARTAKEQAGKDASPIPRGGVAAGEEAAADGTTNTAAVLAGSAAGAALLGGLGFTVIRRRTGGSRA
ncbi:hypothetical protein [Streptomyces sp. MUM 178J]|uniref:hypothetical protein n=1 Tax=Streptomyces sp. MUM 178J TaxID=2791991 RepID=UPI001F035484|nr:hypothetical protein [Streptomyces sp. MUM 178J]WRQ79625.1 hypothetical protein I3F59_009790 [Streptomyces sp. MUM 178J]